MSASPVSAPPNRRARTSGRVTLAQVARAAGVSPMSASNAFRAPERLQAETLQRILQVAGDLGYVPDLVAGTLASGLSPVIGVLLPSMRNSSFQRYVDGLRAGAQQAQRRLILTLADTPKAEAQAVATLISLRVSGVVLIGGDHRGQTLDLLRKTGTPFVETWLLQGGTQPAAGYDAAEAMAEMVQLHLSAGRRQIVLMDHDGALATRYRQRRPAFEAAMTGCPDAHPLIQPVGLADSFAEGAAAMVQILQTYPQVEAVICPTDVTAAGAIFECQRRGLHVPDQIAITGWGNYEIGAQMLPALTTVELDSAAMGQAAIAALVAGPAGAGLNTGYRILRRDSA